MVLGRLPFQRAEDNMWKQIGGDFKYTGGSVRCWIRAEPMNVDFQVDSASLIELNPYSNWKSHFGDQIKRVRTNPLRVTGGLPAGCSPGSTTIKVELTRHEFGFGTSINGKNFVGTTSTEQKYRQFILDNFNWAVFENDHKWKGMEKQRGRVNFGVTDDALDILLAHNFTMRGHTLLWNLMQSNPDFVKAANGGILKNDVIEREDYMLRHYVSDIAEWDLCNEYGHNHFIEERTGDREMLLKEFQKAYSVDPRPEYFLNEFDVLRNSLLTSYISDLGEFLQKKNAHVGGIGIQSHLRELPIDPEVLEKRLEIASRLNLDVSITEFSSHSRNVYVRAAGLEQALTIYFANPKVHCIVLWGFCDSFGNFADDFFLFEGPNLTPNVAGNTLMRLLHNDWTTRETISATSTRVDKTIPNAFRGNYKLTVTCGGQVKAEKQFYVGSGSNTVTF